MQVASSNATIVQMEPIKHKIEFTHAQMIELIKKEYPKNIPEEFLSTMTMAFMAGVKATIGKLGYVVQDQKREELK